MNMNKVALVTGANRGLGYEIARQLGHQHITVVLGARDSTKAQAAADKLKDEGIRAYAVKLDVTNATDIAALPAYFEQQFGRLDILINNAGVNPTMQLEESSLLTVELQTMLSTFTTNVLAVAQIFQALVPMMKTRNYGRIVNVSTEMASLNSLAKDYYPLAPSYRLSKAGLNSITAILAKELQGTNVLVNAYSPGW